MPEIQKFSESSNHEAEKCAEKYGLILIYLICQMLFRLENGQIKMVPAC